MKILASPIKSEVLETLSRSLPHRQHELARARYRVAFLDGANTHHQPTSSLLLSVSTCFSYLHVKPWRHLSARPLLLIGDQNLCKAVDTAKQFSPGVESSRFLLIHGVPVKRVHSLNICHCPPCSRCVLAREDTELHKSRPL